jgi:hypothetical protein
VAKAEKPHSPSKRKQQVCLLEFENLEGHLRFPNSTVSAFQLVIYVGDLLCFGFSSYE